MAKNCIKKVEVMEYQELGELIFLKIIEFNFTVILISLKRHGSHIQDRS